MIRLLLGTSALAFVIGCGHTKEDPAAPGSVPVGVVAEQASPAIGPKAALVESVGLETLGGVFTPLLEVGRAVPCETTQVFSTAADDQDQITITVYRGCGELVRDNHLVGRFRISDFPLAARGVPNIQVRFMATAHDLRILATDMGTSRECRLDRVE